MKQTIDPSFEFDRGPVFWGGLATVLCSIASLFLFQRPGWLLPSAMVGGGVAAVRSGFYEQSATNGFVGVLFGVAVLLPVVFAYRFLFVPAATNTGDLVFLGIVLSVVDVIGYGPLMLVLGYVSAMLVDVLRRRSEGRLGY